MTGIEQQPNAFDQFWAEQNRQAVTETILGVTVTLPVSAPLKFSMEAERLVNSSNVKDVVGLLEKLFGEGTIQKWADAGMDTQQFTVLLAWSMGNLDGKRTTFREAKQLIDDAEQQKTLNEQPGS